MLDRWLVDLPDEEISRAVDAIYDSSLSADMTISRPDLMPIWCNPSTQRMAEHIVRCGFDRTMAMISWNDGNG